ncbi:multicopper oxidase family protein [Yoonia sediminilitoris]|uniref:FtsP/CotA-like multicopper oxidase with cupredoxin domain n=1 Tax=Yoonia sediminilitoris TaxID=1286148 RepID=A0A2T6K945_9RHOB|nr:multicopper oxidase domain-containing protein [Yoonia sediminilitoris]PUB11267.1 FtsP/CotA-like multicopper oxidase with cupredoxin domain [Yoonia sediminilitoris]RCW91083.1 FtsP/CotA-like multicopper oxidase with cupredoxin domain [Yoonia sediminilitoris]
MITRRSFLEFSTIAGGAFALPGLFGATRTAAIPLAAGLSDPSLQPKFIELAPNALDPAFLYKDLNENGKPAMKPDFSVKAGENIQETGLVDPKNGRRLKTPIWGYGNDTISWPGQTIQVVSASHGGAEETIVRWANEIKANEHLLPVDENLHWCYSLHGASSANGVDYRAYSIKKNGVPMIPHLHGGRTDFQFDGNPEYFFSTDGDVKGPQWDFVEGGFQTDFRYDNNVQAGNLWYHDHALGITRLNVYAGLAGFYFVRDEFDTGQPDNPLGLPAFPYELAYAIQDRMFTNKGNLFYPAYPGDPFYDDFITGEGAVLPPDLFPGGGPTALAEFFGDHVVVNGKIWPKANVEPRHYRMRLLNGCDSRFMVLRFRAAAAPSATNLDGASAPIPFWVIGMDQGFAKEPTQTDTLVFEPGGRYDIVFDFSGVPSGSRVIMENIGGDAPFGGAFGDDLDSGDLFPDRQTDRIMAFDVVVSLNSSIPDAFDPSALPGWKGNMAQVSNFRQVALFEGTDEFGRLQPLLGTVNGDGTATGYTWFQDTTEVVSLGTTEIWEIYNFTGDAHPIHLHLVDFEVLDRQDFTFTSDGTVPVPQHSGAFGEVVNVTSITEAGGVPDRPEIVENGPRDMVTALPGDPDTGIGQKVAIKATFDKPGRYVWHCHILSHEDHEMMRVLEVI